MVKSCTILAGIRKPITPHKLRHTFITNVIDKTKDIPLAQKLAGHDDIGTTMRYNHSTHEQTVAKYHQFFDTAPSENQTEPKQSNVDLLRKLDAKFINGEISVGEYQELKNRFLFGTDSQRGPDYDVAYG